MNPLKGLKLYTVHVHPGRQRGGEDPVLVPEGFNFWAFLFIFLWAFYEKLWLEGIAILAVNFALVAINGEYGGLSEPSVATLQLAYQVLIGFHGGDWLRARLQKRGYVLTDIVSGDNPLAAKRRYFERYVAAHA